MVEVGALLAVYLNARKVGVEVGGDFRIFKYLVRHHMAPMAGRVANGHQKPLTLSGSAFNRLVAPFVPVHGLVGVLLKVEARRMLQSIHPTKVAS